VKKDVSECLTIGEKGGAKNPKGHSTLAICFKNTTSTLRSLRENNAGKEKKGWRDDPHQALEDLGGRGEK